MSGWDNSKISPLLDVTPQLEYTKQQMRSLTLASAAKVTFIHMLQTHLHLQTHTHTTPADTHSHTFARPHAHTTRTRTQIHMQTHKCIKRFCEHDARFLTVYFGINWPSPRTYSDIYMYDTFEPINTYKCETHTCTIQHICVYIHINIYIHVCILI